MRLFKTIPLKQNGIKTFSESFAVSIAEREGELGEILESKFWIAANSPETEQYQMDSGNVVDIPITEKITDPLTAGLDSHSDISFIKKSIIDNIIADIAQYQQTHKDYEVKYIQGSEGMHVTTANLSKTQKYEYIILPVVSEITPKCFDQKFYVLKNIPGNRDLIIGNDYFKDLKIKKSLMFEEV
ncbi:MAG: hypothetical protein GF364_08080 [Candidatus Lokiarchaeota archaeon]|nr:hypothetical protein [Candidatus Lokiarchaeota archaeon]